MSYPAIATLPDVPLLNILKRLPLYDLVYGARQTCALMRALAPIVLARRRNLVLSHGGYDRDRSLIALRDDKPHFGHLLQHVRREDGSPMVRLPDLAQFKFEFVPLETAVQGASLMNALPRLTHLTVEYRNISPVFMNRLNRMLNHWSGTLISLKLSLKDLSQFDSLNDLRLIETINGLNSLRHLKICLGDNVMPFNPNTNLEFIARLSTLCVQGMAFTNEWFFASLAQYGTANLNLREVCYHHNGNYDGYNPRMLQFGLDNPRLAACFTFLSTDVFLQWLWDDESIQTMQRLCGRFSSLTTLELGMEPSAMEGLAQQLRRLQHLVTLSLFVSRLGEHDDANDRDAGFVHGWPVLDPNPPPIDAALLVHSVQLLQLYLLTESHENLAAIRIAHYFPNIQLLSGTQFSGNCRICTPEAHPPDFTIYRCLRQALQPFRACAHLRTIEYNPGLGSEMEQITPQQLPLNLD